MSSKQSKKQHNFFSLSCKLVKDASLFFISASYLQNKKHVCHLIQLQIVQLGNAMCPLSTIPEPFAQATLYCSIVAGFNPQLNHSMLIMISPRSSNFLLQTQSDNVSRKSLSISALLFLLMICLSYLVWTYMLVPYELACSYEVLGLTGWPDRLA